MIDWYIIAVVLITGYIIGLLQKGININTVSYTHLTLPTTPYV